MGPIAMGSLAEHLAVVEHLAVAMGAMEAFLNHGVPQGWTGEETMSRAIGVTVLITASYPR